MAVNIYSPGLDVQAIGLGLLKVPRLLWSLTRGVISCSGCRATQSPGLDLLNVIAYWLTLFLAIIFSEHIIWRRGFEYDLTGVAKSTQDFLRFCSLIYLCR
jgi:purine-cytosine permease-like protein